MKRPRLPLLWVLTLLIGASRAQDPGTATLPDSIMAPGTPVVWVKQLQSYCEGPAVNQAGILHFTQQMGGNTQAWPIWKINPAVPADTGSVFLLSSDQANGLEFDAQDRLVAAQKGKVTRYGTASQAKVLVKSGDGGVTFGGVNDLSQGTGGSFYFTDFATKVYFSDTAGNVKVAWSSAQISNGVQWVPEKGQLYFSEGTGGGQITRMQVAADGTLSNPQRFAGVPIPDGMTMDEHGNFYFASYGEGAVFVVNGAGIQIGKIFVTPSGKWNVTAGATGNVSNCAFGGSENKTLYMTGDGGAYSIRLKIAGRRLGASTGLGGRGPGLSRGMRLELSSRRPGAPISILLSGSPPGLLLQAFDFHGREVWRSRPAPGQGMAVWDGTGFHGAPVPSGRYALAASSGRRSLALGSVPW